MSTNQESIDQVYNVALNERTSLNELYKLIQDKLVERVEGLEQKSPVYRDFRAGDVRHSQASIHKAQEFLNYRPQYKVSDGLNEAIDWYIDSLK
jgi:UDP-N-acetylglucosamine 4-epimerase